MTEWTAEQIVALQERCGGYDEVCMYALDLQEATEAFLADPPLHRDDCTECRPKWQTLRAALEPERG